MVPAPLARRPLVGSTLLALLLAVGTVAVAVGRDGPAPAGPISAVAPLVTDAGGSAGQTTWADPEPRYDGFSARLVSATQVAGTIARPGPRIAIGAAAAASTQASAGSTSSVHQGRNHVWMPALGIDRSVSFFSCSNGSYPGNRVYRWGCAGSNNVYLFGHACSVFKPLHDAYVRGRLGKGMKLYYADGGGRVHTYSVSWWKLTTATKGIWAYKSLSRPSLTLQTCIGARNQYRLIVRLVRVD